MHTLPLLALFHFSTSSLTQFLDRWGYLAVFLFVGIESSGIPFPGETMLITAAVYAGAGHLSIAGVIAAGAAGAIVGDNLGYTAGRFGGRALVTRYGSYVRIKPYHLERGEQYFERHGDKTVFLGRFVAVLRAWAAFLAGVNRMPWPKFLVFNAAGGITWAIVFGLLGYILGHNLPLLHKVVDILGIGGVVVAAIVIVIAFILWKRRQAARQTMSAGPEGSDT
jgi:membrane protein DedA with SNARE-associated domain